MLLLTWSLPEAAWSFDRSVDTATLFRMIPGAGRTEQINDIPWGFYEDTENNDPAARYWITLGSKTLGQTSTSPDTQQPTEYFLDSAGALAKKTEAPQASYTIDNTAIRRWVRPAESCRVDLEFRRPDTSPDVGRSIWFADLPHGYHRREIVTNWAGKAHFVMGYGQRMRLDVDGWAQSLEFAAPRKRLIHISELIEHGSWVPRDMRSRM